MQATLYGFRSKCQDISHKADKGYRRYRQTHAGQYKKPIGKEDSQMKHDTGKTTGSDQTTKAATMDLREADNSVNNARLVQTSLNQAAQC